MAARPTAGLKRRRYAGAICLALASVLPAPARSASDTPAGLRGKSVIVKWSESRTFLLPKGPIVAPWEGTMTLYVSEAGRIFSKVVRTNAPTRTTVSGENDAPGGTPQWRFVGGKLVGTNTFVKGARKVTITFSDGFARCAIDVVYGKQDGEPIVIFNPVSGKDHPLTSTTILSKDCTVQGGNVFSTPQ